MELNAHIFVPGHGPLGTRENLGKMKNYIYQCEHAVQGLIEKGEGEDGISQMEIPDQFSNWEFPDFFHINARFIFQKIQKQ